MKKCFTFKKVNPEDILYPDVEEAEELFFEDLRIGFVYKSKKEKYIGMMLYFIQDGKEFYPLKYSRLFKDIKELKDWTNEEENAIVKYYRKKTPEIEANKKELKKRINEMISGKKIYRFNP